MGRRREEHHRYIDITIVIQPEDGMYAAYCNELGTVSCGDTIDEAFRNILEAVELHLNALEDLGERPRFFRERGIKLKTAPRPRSVPRRNSLRYRGFFFSP